MMKAFTAAILLWYIMLTGVPCALAQWVPTAGPVGGAVYSLAVRQDTSSTVLFAGTLYRGMFRSTDLGGHWTLANNGLPSLRVTAIGSSGPMVFAGTDKGIFRSSNDGETWSDCNTALTRRQVNTFCASDGAVFAGTDSGLFVSTNNGDLWASAEEGLTDLNIHTIITVPRDTGSPALFVGTDGGGVCHSEDMGAHWASASTGLPGPFVWALAATDSSILAATDRGIFRSTDRGEEWFRFTSGPYTLCLLSISSPAAGKTIIAGRHSNNAGISILSRADTSWVDLSQGLGEGSWYLPSVYALAASKNISGGIDLFAGTERGIFLARNGVTPWQAVNKGLTNTIAYAMSLLPPSDAAQSPGLAAATDFALCVTTDEGLSWTRVNSTFYYTRTFASPGAPFLYLGFTAEVRRVSDWGDGSYSDINLGPGTGQVLALVTGPPAGRLAGRNLFAGTARRGVLFSFTEGVTWTPANNGLYDTTITALAISPVPADQEREILYAASSAGRVFVSYDDGKNWTLANDGLPGRSIDALAAHHNSIYALSQGKILRSSVGTTDWVPFDDGIQDQEVLSLSVVGQYLYAGTKHASVWRRPVTDVAASASSYRDVPEEWGLAQNWPNPFNPATSIAYTVHSSQFTVHSTDVRLTVYDLLGREVATLVNEKQAPGRYTVRFDAGRLASGVYLYRLQAGSFVETKRMLLLR